MHVNTKKLFLLTSCYEKEIAISISLYMSNSMLFMNTQAYHLPKNKYQMGRKCKCLMEALDKSFRSSKKR